MVVRKLQAALLGSMLCGWATLASAQVFQTDAAKTPLPQPLVVSMGSNTEWGLVGYAWGRNSQQTSNVDPAGMNANPPIVYGEYYSPANGFPQFEEGDAITLSGLFKWRHEQIDPVADARIAPGYFSPSCGFSGQLLLMGGNCQVAFGWYNVEDPTSTTAPKPEEIYEFIPNDPAYLNCKNENGGPKTDGFCPLAWDTLSPRNLSIAQWTPKAFDSGNIKNDPRYKGPYVGFALIGNPQLSCKQNKYSMYAHNQRNAQDQPWVTTLIYQSTVDPEGFYMAFEDLPMSPSDWHESGGQYKNDGDFNDFVFYVSGISCLGGGEPCDTGLQGACSVGRTDCASDGETGMCRPIIAPGGELCDNVDNDCNGIADDGEGLCPGREVCEKGTCVEPCGTAEFRCEKGFSCKSGHCIETACAEMACDPGKACRGGTCVDACAGVVCPTGQECQLGRCVDPCKAIECPAGKVCERGLCVSDCSCRGCAEGLACGADGRCSDPACVGVPCEPGEKCVLGDCIDPCVGVMCPGGGACVQGACQMGAGASAGSGGNGPASGPLVLGGTSSNPSGNPSSGPARKVGDPGCACEVAGRAATGAGRSVLGLLGFGLLLGLGGLRRRRGLSVWAPPSGRALH